MKRLSSREAARDRRASGTLTKVMSSRSMSAGPRPPSGSISSTGRTRIVATGNDAAAFKGQTVRLLITNVQTLQSRKAVLDRYMKAYRETVDFMYKDPAALKIYAEFIGISDEKAKRSRDDFFPPESIYPDKVVGLDTILKDAVALKYTPQELTKSSWRADQIPPSSYRFRPTPAQSRHRSVTAFTVAAVACRLTKL